MTARRTMSAIAMAAAWHQTPGPDCDISKRPWNRFHNPFSRLRQAAVPRL
jgi:hypothetical protein